jgi:hypothetical protein
MDHRRGPAHRRNRLARVSPSESLLHTGSILATQDGSPKSDRVAQAERNEKVAETFAMLHNQAPTLIVFGRFVPGVRFVVGASMGLIRYSYPRFLLWDTIGGIAWASFACISSGSSTSACGVTGKRRKNEAPPPARTRLTVSAQESGRGETATCPLSPQVHAFQPD